MRLYQHRILLFNHQNTIKMINVMNNYDQVTMTNLKENEGIILYVVWVLEELSKIFSSSLKKKKNL